MPFPQLYLLDGVDEQGKEKYKCPMVDGKDSVRAVMVEQAVSKYVDKYLGPKWVFLEPTLVKRVLNALAKRVRFPPPVIALPARLRSLHTRFCDELSR